MSEERRILPGNKDQNPSQNNPMVGMGAFLTPKVMRFENAQED